MTNAASTKMMIEDMIRHYQRSIERSQHDPKRILHCIGKLNRMHVTVKHLQLTKIGKTINSLRKDDGEVGEAAKALVAKWKDMVNNCGSGEENAQDEYNEDNQNCDNDDDDTNNAQIHSVSRSERKTHKNHEYTIKSGSSGSNNIHYNNNEDHRHPHRDQYAIHEHRSPEEINNVQNHHRKYSSDDTQEYSVNSKYKQKSHSHNSNSSNSSKREHEAESNGSASSEHDRHKMSSKHHSKEDRHHRSRHETQHNGDEYSDKKHKSSSKDKHSEHHKSHSSSTHTSSKHKRSRESDHSSNSSKKHRSDPTSHCDEKKGNKTIFKHVDDGIEIDNSMGTSFADALGMLAPPSHSSKASTSVASSSTSGKSSNKTISPKSSTSSSSSQNKSKSNEKPKSSTSSSSRSETTPTPSLLWQKPKLPPLEDLAKDLPTSSECFISNDYKPTPLNPMILDCLYKGTKSQPITMLSETDSLCASTTSKNQRTKVYSGVKSGVLLNVPTLHELCIRLLQKNVDALEYTGGVPFEILKPVLERATPEQLAYFEHYNPYLMDDSDILWQQHCQRKFKGFKRQEMETWREMFDRCKSEQEARLNRLTKNIIKSQSVAIPVRQTKLAYVDSMVKPPRNIIKKQNQFGTHCKPIVTPAARVDALSSVASNITRPGDIRLKTTPSMRDTAQAQQSNVAFKPKKAPLMAKTLQLLKGRMRR